MTSRRGGFASYIRGQRKAGGRSARFFSTVSTIFFISLCLECQILPAFALSHGSTAASLHLHQLIKNMAWNESHSRKHPAHSFEFVLTEQTPQSLIKTLEIQTLQGTVSLPISINGKPPSEKQIQRSRRLLEQIASDPGLQQTRLKSQQADEDRRIQLLSAMPRAFLFKYVGTEESTGWLQIKFRPNPQFHPRSREGGVLRGMKGTLWVDPVEQRLVHIRGRLVHDVTFGWGILARLYQGSSFVMDQSQVGEGVWHVTRLNVSMHGTILLFRKLNVVMENSYSSFRVLPKGLTIDQAISDLEHAQASPAQ